MKTNMEIDSGTLLITCPKGQFSAVVDIETGEVSLSDWDTATIDELYRFVHAVRLRYRKFLNSKAAEDFKF